jgi:hypothetical protein
VKVLVQKCPAFLGKLGFVTVFTRELRILNQNNKSVKRYCGMSTEKGII